MTAVGDAGPEEVARHQRGRPGHPRYVDEHFGPEPEGPLHRTPVPMNEAEAAFLAMGAGAVLWLTEAGAAGRCDPGRRWPTPSRWPPLRLRQGRPGAGRSSCARPVRRG